MTTPAPIVYLVPSRGRPGNIVELVDAWDTTRAGAADLVVAVDLDDARLDDYLDLPLPEWATVVTGPRLRLGGTLNALSPELAGRYRAVGFMGDDHRPRSLGWDQRLEAELAPGAVIYGNDLVQGAALPTAVLLERLVVDELGYFVPPGMLHLWLDNYWLELGRRLRTLRYLADVVIEHVHPITGRAEWDDGYRENNSPETWSADEATFKRYAATELDVAVDRIAARIALEAGRP